MEEFKTLEVKQVETGFLQFDGEKWLYQRQEAYPMVTCQECPLGKGIFGMSCKPIIFTKGVPVILEHNEYIVKDEYGGYSVYSEEDFKKEYPWVFDTKEGEGDGVL